MNPLHLSDVELSALRNLQSGFYDPPLDHALWGRLRELDLIAVREPPSSPVVLTVAGRRYAVHGG